MLVLLSEKGVGSDSTSASVHCEPKSAETDKTIVANFSTTIVDF